MGNITSGTRGRTSLPVAASLMAAVTLPVFPTPATAATEGVVLQSAHAVFHQEPDAGGCGEYARVSVGAGEDPWGPDHLDLQVAMGDTCTGKAVRAESYGFNSLEPREFKMARSARTARVAADTYITHENYECDESDCWSKDYPVQVQVKWTATSTTSTDGTRPARARITITVDGMSRNLTTTEAALTRHVFPE